MHSAPSVTYPVGRSSFAVILLLSLWVAAAAATCAWWLHGQQPIWRLSAALLLLVAAGAWAAAAGWWRAPVGELAWSGEGWAWSPDPGGGTGTLQTSLDLQQWMLVRWRAAGKTQWLWLERGRCPERWIDLRRAVYSRAEPSAPADARAQAGKP